MTASERVAIFVDNVAIVESQDTTSLAPSTISVQEFLSFTGDMSQTVAIAAAPQPPGHEGSRTEVLGLFGSWQEGANDDQELVDLYRSRLVASSSPDDE